MPARASPLYTAGVAVGQWASYSPINVTYHGTYVYSSVPQQIKDLNATALFTTTIQHLYTSTNVTVQSVTQNKNGTIQTSIRNGDLMSGMGNLTFELIAGGLSSPNPLSNAPYTPTINQTVSMTFLGVSRTVNMFNNTYRQPFGHSFATISQEYFWDQKSGIVLEFKALSVNPGPPPDGGFVEYTDVKIQSTNIFSNPYSPDFAVSASNPASVTSGTLATSTITITAIKGFSEMVALTDTVPSGLTCNPIDPGTLPGHGTTSLSCSSTIPGTYRVNITAASGPTIHTTRTTMTITSPSQAPNAPILGLAPIVFYATIVIVIFIIAATCVYLYMRSRSASRAKTATTTTTR